MPESIPKELTTEDVRRTLAEIDSGIDRQSGTATCYKSVHKGRHYPPKAVIGLACRSLRGRILRTRGLQRRRGTSRTRTA